MLTCPPSRINLTTADISDFERRWAARRPARPKRTPPASARLSTGAAHLTKLGYVPASANIGRKRAESCSSQATICTVADDEAIHSGDDATPLADLSGSPIRPVSERGPSRIEYPVGRDTISIAGTIERASPQRRPPQILPPYFTIHEDTTLDQAETEAKHLRKPQIFRRAVADTVLQHLATAAPELVQSSDEIGAAADESPGADPTLNPPLDAEAPVFIPRTRFGTVANHSPNSSHGGDRCDGIDTSTSKAQPAHLRLQSSFERNLFRSYYGSERDNASSSRSDTIAPVRMVQTRRRSRTQDQYAATQNTIPDLGRYPAMTTLPFGVGMNDRRSSATHRRVVLPRRSSSRAHLVEYERARMARMASGRATPSQSADLRTHHQDRLRSVSPAPSSSSRSTPNLLLRGLPAPVIHPRSSSFSSNRQTIPEETDPSAISIVGPTDFISRRAFEDNYLNRDSPLEELARKLNHAAVRQSQRSFGRSFERPPVANRPSLLNGNPFRLDSPERRIDRPPGAGSPPHRSVSPCHGHSASRGAVQQAIEKFDTALEVHTAIEKFDGARERLQSVSPRFASVQTGKATVHRSQTQSSFSSAFEDPVAFALALPPETVPLSPASTPLPSSPRSPSSAYESGSVYVPNTPPVHSAAASPQHSSTTRSRSSIARSSISRIPHSLDAAVTPKVTIYNDDKSPSMQPQTPADVSTTRSGRRFRPRSDMGSMHQSTLTTSAETPSHAAVERHPYRNTYPTATPPQHHAAQYSDSGMTPARQQVPTSAQRSGRADRYRRELSENETEAHLAELEGMEQDRRTWISRQEDGNLDVTPPREGRWERYLS